MLTSLFRSLEENSISHLTAVPTFLASLSADPLCARLAPPEGPTPFHVIDLSGVAAKVLPVLKDSLHDLMVASLEIEGGLDRTAFPKSWEEITGRHAVLRSSFHIGRFQKPMQVVKKGVRLPLKVLSPRPAPPSTAVSMSMRDAPRAFSVAVLCLRAGRPRSRWPVNRPKRTPTGLGRPWWP